MRSFVRHGLVVGVCLGALITSAGCEQKKATEYVTGVSTQVTVPRDLKAVRVQIINKGFVEFCQNYKVYNGKILLPRSLGNFPKSSDGNQNSITFSIVGLTDDYNDGSATNPVFTDCLSNAAIGQNNVRILRRSTQPYVPDHILFLPMALKYSCFDKECKDGETCKGGLCVNEITDPKSLVEFADGMGDGTDGACFSTGLCMGAAIPAVPVNGDTCDFAVAESDDANKIATLPADKNPFRPKCTTTTDCGGGRACNNGQCDLLPPGSPPWTGVNVEVSYDGGQTKEILDYDKDEGFFVPDPTKPQTFRLAPGLCQLLKGKDAEGKPTPHRITSIRAAGVCSAKQPSQSICLADQLKIMGGNEDGSANDVNAALCKAQPLIPAKSALVLVVDNTTEHENFFKAEVQDELKAPLADPAFESTDIGLLLADASAAPLPTATCGGGQPLTLPIKNATTGGGVNALLANFSNTSRALSTGTPDLENAVQSAYDSLTPLGPEYARRAVVLLSNRKMDVSTCGTPDLPSANAAKHFPTGTPTIATYATKLTKSGTGGADAAGLIPTTGSPKNELGQVGYLGDASQNPEDKKQVLQDVINYLATCLYDVPVDDKGAKLLPTEDGTLSYADPLRAVEIKVAPLASGTTACAAGQTGWFLDKSDAANPRIQVCGQACTDYRKVLSDTSTFTVLYKQPSIPVPLFHNTKECYTK